MAPGRATSPTMSDTDTPSPSPPTVVPVGAAIIEAASWVGHACWAELRLHQVLTEWLAVELDAELSVAFWAVRAHRAELAEAWHARLPELRELSRAGFVEPGDPWDGVFTGMNALTGPDQSSARLRSLVRALATVGGHYDAHVAVAVGPADGPTAATLSMAIERTALDLAALPVGAPDGRP